MGESLPHYEEGHLDVGQGHTLYWRAHGEPTAPVVLIVHGGPGGAMNPSWAKFFNPAEWRIVLFDQRGCGQSTPFGRTDDNHLAALVEDIERLRTALGVNRWALFGGSWGTTLAIAYGVAYPQRCTGFLLRGVFLARREDIDWFLWDVRRVFPEAHAAFLDAIERASGTRPRNRDEILSLAAAPLARYDAAGIALARAWAGFEAKLSAVGPMPGAKPPPAAAADDTATAPKAPDKKHDGAENNAEDKARAVKDAERRAVSMALLEHHYMAHDLPAPDLLSRVGVLAEHPCRIVHGRFDMVCLAEQAVALSAAWPKAALDVVDASGHWTFEPGIEKALMRAAGELRRAILGQIPR